MIFRLRCGIILAMLIRRAILLLLSIVLLYIPVLSADTLSYQVVVNTSSISGTMGFLDLQLDPGPGADAAQASVFAFSTNGSLYSSPLNGNTGDATGTLPGTVVLQNGTIFNDSFQGVDFGTSILFDVSFSGTAISSPSGTNAGSTFSVGLYDSTASNPLLTDDPSGAVALANIGPYGSFSFTGTPNADGGPSVVTITPLNTSPSPVPEPSTYVLMLSGCAALFLIRRKLRAARGALVAVALVVAFGAVAAHAAAPKAHFSTSPSGAANGKRGIRADDASPAGCPNQGGILQVVSVPVANSVTLYIYVGEPSPITTTFQITSTNTAIVGGSQNQGYIPEVTLLAGNSTSSAFTIYGQSLGEAALTATDESGYFGGFTVPVTSWDLNAGDSMYKLIDANPATNTCRDPDSGSISTNPSLLATCGTSAKGVATDGVTNLLLRLSAALPGTACYAISSTSALDQGQVETAVNNTQSVNGLDDAFSLYTAPANYGDASASRMVQFTFYYTPSQELGNGNTTMFTANLNVVRPPVMLIHGIWGSGVWPNFFIKNDQTHWTFPADYSATNASSYSVNFPNVQTWIAQTLNKARNNGIAVTQADVIAHSMGGILTRLYASSSKFQRDDNYEMGDVHRLVTLDTPHIGSSFANLIVGLHNAVPAQTETTVASITGGTITQGAVCDLSENSQGLTGLNAATNLSGMVVTGTGAPAGSPTNPAPYWNGLAGLGSFEKALTKQTCVKSFLGICTEYGPYVFPQATVNGFRFRQQNDSVVPLSSQQGGVAGGTNYPDLVHSGYRKFGINFVSAVNNDSSVATQVYTLLDQDKSSFVSSFSGVNSAGTGAPLTVPGRGNGLDVKDWAAQCGAGGPMHGAAASPSPGAVPGKQNALAIKPAYSSLVQITSPTAGESFVTSESVTVNVQVAASLNATDGILFIAGLDEYAPTTFSPTGFSVTVPIPEYSTGSFVLTPAVTDSQGNMTFGAPVTIGVKASGTVTSVALVERNYYLSPTDGSQELHLIGTFANDLQLDLTSSATGTKYVSNNPKVVSVDSEGNFTVVGTGIASITATNSGLSDYAVFVVQDPLKPLAPLDVTKSATIRLSGFTLNRQTGFFVGSMTITAASGSAVPGPLIVLLNGLTAGVSLVNGNGITVNTNAGTPYISLTLPGQGLVFSAGQSVVVPLQFLDPARSLITFTPSLLRTSSVP